MIIKTKFDTLNGAQIDAYTLDTGKGFSAEIITFGGIVRRLTTDGVDVALSKENMDGFLDNEECFGAIIGRNSNRIANARFTLNGAEYQLKANDNAHNLHGGEERSFRNRIWEAEAKDGDEPQLILHLESPDMEEGFPGNVTTKVVYTLTADKTLRIAYEATTDKETIVSMTNHSYFNLNGHNSGTVENHKLAIYADYYTPADKECIPTGEIRKVDGTAFDLRNGVVLKDVLFAEDEQLRQFGGFDHNFCLSGQGFRKVASLTGDQSGITMDTYTDRIGVQLYTGNLLEEKPDGKDGAVYKAHNGLCLETQMFPDAANNPQFPPAWLKPGEVYKTVTEYRFKR